MSLLDLSASVCRQFSEATFSDLRNIQKVKGHQRDVVTSLDQRLHQVAVDFVELSMQGCELMSEEGESEVSNCLLDDSEWLVVDPLDGSNNYSLSLPSYGFMAAHVVGGCVSGSVVVLPEHSIYIVYEEGRMVISQPISTPNSLPGGSVYYAYPPTLSHFALKSRAQLIDLIDQTSSGLYRYGSSCIGLYNLICGKHSAFIGHGIRIWDALAFFPILEHFGINFQYYIDSSRLILVASSSKSFIHDACSIISEAEHVDFSSVDANKRLVISS